MATLSGNSHAYNTKVEVIKGIKAIRIYITNRILMDINGYYYGRSWACLALFSKLPTYICTVKMTGERFKSQIV